MTLNTDDIRDRLEDRWERIGYDALLPEERDFILTWWLEAEASNGSLHQYFANSAGDSAVDALAALDRIGASRAADVLRDAINLFRGGPYPTDRVERNKMLDAIWLEITAMVHYHPTLSDRIHGCRHISGRCERRVTIG